MPGDFPEEAGDRDGQCCGQPFQSKGFPEEADRLGDEDSVAETSGGDEPYAGLTRGSSGPGRLLRRVLSQR